MNLRAIQAPLKELYRNQPEVARVTLKAEGELGEGVSCKVDTGRTLVEAGLHPATGGTGAQACSGDMLLEALVACAPRPIRIFAAPWRGQGRPRRLHRHPARNRPREHGHPEQLSKLLELTNATAWCCKP